ncbi:MAG TPA: oligosaccharide flippase family protein [Gemmatimonadota bacterium]|jgi:O-antigen/teichoic acid export membrane protein
MGLALFSQLFYKLAGYVVLVVLARHLAKDRMGEFFFAATLAMSLAMLTELGLNTLLVREAARAPADGARRLSEVLSIRLPLLGLYLAALGGGALLVDPSFAPVLALTAVYVGLDDLYLSFGALFVGLKRIAWNVTAGVASKVLLVALVAGALRAGGGLLAVLAGYVAASGLLLGIAWTIAHRRVGPVRLAWDPALARRLIPSSLPFLWLSLLALLHFNVDTVMLGPLAGFESVANYQVGFRLLEATLAVLRPVSVVFFPLCAELAGHERWGELRELAARMLLLAGGAALAGAAVVVVAAGVLLTTLFGEAYAGAAPVLRVLFLAAPPLFVSTIGILIAKSLGLERAAGKALLASVLLNAALNAVAIPRAGPVGAAWSTVVSHTFLAVWVVLRVRRGLAEAAAPASVQPEPVLV